MFHTIFSSEITLMPLLIMLFSAAAIGILNTLVFSFRNRITKSFALTLALLPLISSVIIFLVNDHLGVSVAVAGAFTLVRFRSIKGTGREIVAIFASMAIGSVLGMGYIGMAVVVFLVIALLTLALTAMNFGGSDNVKQLRITIPEDLEYDGIFDDIFRKYLTSSKLESIRTKNMGTLFELTYEATFKGDSIPKAFLDELRTRNGNLPIVAGEYADQEKM